MSRQSLIWLVVSLMCGAVSVMATTQVWAQNAERLAIVNRQKVRADLAAALADGKLTRKEQYSILLEAKDLLAPGDLRGLQRTMDHAAAQREAASPRVATREGTNHNLGATLTGFIVPPEENQSDNPFLEEGAAAIAGSGRGIDGTNDLYDDEGIFTDAGAYTYNGWNNIQLLATVDAFRGPVDLANQDGNFGGCLGFNGGFPLFPARGIGVHVCTSEVLSDFQGTEPTSDEIRYQNFTTVGFFQRNPFNMPRLSWGFGFDWLRDHYYQVLTFGQWRVKVAYELDDCNEVGFWACIPSHGTSATVPERSELDPVAQGIFYSRRYWSGGQTTACWIGAIDEPGEFVIGGDATIPLTPKLALIGNFNYVRPSGSGITGQGDEMWNLSMGISWTPGAGKISLRPGPFAPLMRPANNGTFAIRRE